MPAKWIRVQDTRTKQILPNSVPDTFLAKFPYLKEVPSSRRAGSQPDASQSAVLVPQIDEPAESGKNVNTTTITEPVVKPGKK